MKYTQRQLKIIEMVKNEMPVTSDKIAKEINLSRAAIRNDLSILVMKGILEAKPKVGYFYIGFENSEDICKKIKETTVGEVMSIPVVVEEKSSVYDGIITMFLEDTGTIFIANRGYLSGIISRKDFLKIVMGGSDINRIPVGIIMTRMPNVKYVFEDTPLIQAADMIILHEIDSLPVVHKEIIEDEEKYRIVGRISKTNITRTMVESFKEK
jgi:CBS domain-containing protein/biotin operon repressor